MSASTRTYGGRYAVIERVGTGGMSAVYRARDELLGRDVALKVLSERLSRDGSFVERFRREAQAAANLNHPNIVSLYDYGADDGSYFIVMEYIDGRSLADIIRDEGPLLPERAAEIASDVAMALGRAHAAGLVHRDIKPANIMITSSGQTKVTDFGIARALTRNDEQTVTQTGMVIGTAAYLSPEQAEGNPVDARSDIYALGCVLYEMLTARPPFRGDTPLAIAYKHVRESAMPPSSSNPDVPAAMDAVVMRALAKNPDNRYASATEIKQDLDRFLSGQKVQATPILADDTAVAARPGQTQVLRRTDYMPSHEPSRSALWYVLLTLLILGLVALAAWFVAANLLGQQVSVPSVVGKNLNGAITTLQGRGLGWRVNRKHSAKPIDQVLRQDPRRGSRVDKGSTVTLVVSSGLQEVRVPDVGGETRQNAIQILKRADLAVGKITTQSSDSVPAGAVISQSPAPGTRINSGTPVDLLISSGRATVSVPYVIGETQQTAIAELHGAGLRATITTAPSNQPQGTVIAQNPASNAQAHQGDVVQITVSKGQPQQAMPNVVGQNADSAQRALENNYGLHVTQQTNTSPCTQPPGFVCRQSPAPGTGVSRGDRAILYVQPTPTPS